MTARTPTRLAWGLFSTVMCVGGSGRADPQEEGLGWAIRLLDRLGEAKIASPLLGLTPARELTELEDPDGDVLLMEGFDGFDWGFAGWPTVSEASVVEGEGGSYLRLAGVGDRDDAAMGWILPVNPDAFYHFERSVRVEGSAFCDFYVVESRQDLEDTSLGARDYFLAGRGEALKVHSLPVPRPMADGSWQRDSTSFYPTPRTRSLVVLIRPHIGDSGAPGRAMGFDDIELREVFPSRKERMRLLQGQHLARGADPDIGMHKEGWLLPLPSPGGSLRGEPDQGNYNWREALYAPPETTVTFPLTFPGEGRLRLATGLSRETPPKAAARFQIEVTPSGGETTRLLDQVRRAEMEEWSWEEVDLDLSAWAGQEGTLTLRTVSEKGDPHPLWASPRIETAAGEDDPLTILIAVDTLRADRLSAYGYERTTTPALDRLAAEGVRFDQTRSNCNWTCPSFASIFTGLVPSRHGVSSYGPATPLPEELVTLAEHFQARGWATHSIAYKVPLFDGNYEQGFDEAFNVPRDMIRGEENLARALEWLEGHRGGPTFLFLHFNDPHQPFIHPEPLDREFDAEGVGFLIPMDVPSAEDEERRAKFAALYDGAVAYVDSCIGRFLEALRERGMYDRATIAFVADHGEQLWEHGRFGHGGMDLYDEIVRVPLIVKPPKETFVPGKVIEANVSAFDVMPTLLDLAGIAPAGALDARSLLPLIHGKANSLERVVVSENSGRGLALVEGPWKYVAYAAGRGELLFHLGEDPAEESDLCAERPAQLARMRELAIAYLLEHRPGNYLLARSGAEVARLEVSTDGVRVVLGVPEDANTGNGRSWAKLPAESWFLLELTGIDADQVVVQGLEAKGPLTGFQAWESGRLADLGGPGVWRFHGPRPRATVQSTPEEEIDPEVLEALRRLGYAE